MTFEGHLGDLLTVVTLCVECMHELLAIAEFIVAPPSSDSDEAVCCPAVGRAMLFRVSVTVCCET